jgi:hypothetical protein
MSLQDNQERQERQERIYQITNRRTGQVYDIISHFNSALILNQDIQDYYTRFINLLNQNSIHHIFDLNTQETKNKIKDKINSKPSLSDKEGYIYGYQHEITNVKYNYYIKIGKSVDPSNRVIKQWKAKIIFIIYSKYYSLAERIIHLMLKYCNEILRDSQTQENRLEWFLINDLNVIDFVNKIINILNELFNPTSNIIRTRFDEIGDLVVA